MQFFFYIYFFGGGMICLIIAKNKQLCFLFMTCLYYNATCRFFFFLWLRAYSASSMYGKVACLSQLWHNLCPGHAVVLKWPYKNGESHFDEKSFNGARECDCPFRLILRYIIYILAIPLRSSFWTTMDIPLSNTVIKRYVVSRIWNVKMCWFFFVMALCTRTRTPRR